jgi:glyoxylase-like metal-dependent hydrolase (beta-lactamase superfamily II)
MMVWLPQKNLLFTGDVVYVDRMLGVLPVSHTRRWLDTFAVIEQLNPQVLVPGHGSVTTVSTAKADTQALLLALRAHMKKAVDDGVDVSAAVKSFNGKPFAHLKHADVWIPQLANMTYLEMERE